ncbi:MAG: hypothetical protein AAFU67_18790, partial [Bacteroidota bacterium]
MTKDTIIKNEKQRAAARAEHRDSFIASNFWLWVFVRWIIYPTAALLSGITEGANIFLRTGNALPYVLAVLVTVMVVIVVEGLIFFLGKGIVDDLQAGVLSATGARQFAFAVKIISFIAVFSFSMWQSLCGAPLLYKYFEESNESLALLLTDESTIDEKYAEQRATQLSLIEDGRNSRYRGSITAEGLEIMKKAQVELALLDERIEDEKLTLRTNNE